MLPSGTANGFSVARKHDGAIDGYNSMGFSQPGLETGRNCIQCGECEKKCPYQLPIREMIVENMAFYERVAAEHAVHLSKYSN